MFVVTLMTLCAYSLFYKYCFINQKTLIIYLIKHKIFDLVFKYSLSTLDKLFKTLY